MDALATVQMPLVFAEPLASTSWVTSWMGEKGLKRLWIVTIPTLLIKHSRAASPRMLRPTPVEDVVLRWPTLPEIGSVLALGGGFNLQIKSRCYQVALKDIGRIHECRLLKGGLRKGRWEGLPANGILGCLV